MAMAMPLSNVGRLFFKDGKINPNAMQDMNPPPQLHPVANFLAGIGLETPMKRGLALAGLTAAFCFLLQPSFMFGEGHSVRKWRLLNPDDREATDLPLLFAIGAGAIVGYFLL